VSSKPGSFPPPGPSASRTPTIPPSQGTLADPPKPSATQSDAPPRPTEQFQAGSIGERRLRVSVRFSVRDPQLFVVRPLADGTAPPAGAQEAFLTLMGPEQERQSTFNGAPHDE
jgi:hypothetical protein